MSRPSVILSSAPASTAFLRRPITCAIALALSVSASAAVAQVAADEDDAEQLETIHVTAAEIGRQALGTSIITTSDIERRPPANDLSDILRTMPGVNLTGNSSSGQYGNNRQIDLRGMGPENTLILVDGKPVGSRDSIRMGRSGERNTRGDTNWVPAEMVDRIEVLRGPAAARYGSGASGGVINIITKRPTGELSGSINLYAMQPQHDEEGDGQRASVQLSGPLSDALSFRLYANHNRTDADSLDLNADYVSGVTPPAGREGVKNKDINALLRWDMNEDHVVEFEGGTSRQGNIYAGDRAVSAGGTDLLTQLAESGAETNRMYRTTGAVTHRAAWGANSSRLTVAYEATNNKRLNEGLAGGPEGSISSAIGWSTSRLRNYSVDGELNLLSTLGGHDHVWTLGFEHRSSELDDPYSVTQSSAAGGGIPGLPTLRDGKNDATLTAVFVEDNIYLGQNWIITPGVRFDHHSQFGNNLSPSLNAQYDLGGDFTLKGGIARAFKAPNLYQSNPGYLYYTMGNGCPIDYPNLGAGCYVMGNGNLDAETSINKEIGIEWSPLSGHHASLTYFHNDYKNKIEAGITPIGLTENSLGQVFEWNNAPDAVVRGFEGNLAVPLLGDAGNVLKWNTNLTWMIENKNKNTGQPLSVIPEYTLNTSLDWQASEALSVYFTGTFYGDQESASQHPTTGSLLNPDVRGAYSLWSLSGRYRFTPKVSLGAGINNLFDKRLFRESNSNSAVGSGNTASAATYNEPGRAFYVSLSLGF